MWYSGLPAAITAAGNARIPSPGIRTEVFRFTEAEEAEIFAELDKDYISGITFLRRGSAASVQYFSGNRSWQKKFERKYPD